jgi:aminopeptidase
MFTQTELQRYADVLLWGLKKARNGRFRKGDIILLRYDPPALPLAEILYRKLLEAGRHPVLRTNLNAAMERSFYDVADPGQLAFIPSGEKELYETLNGGIFLHAPESITHLAGVNPKKIGRVAVSRKALRNIMDRRDEKGFFGWTLCVYPTRDLARHAKISQKEYARQIADACFLNTSDPIEQWQKIFQKAVHIKKRLNRLPIRRLHVVSDNMDLIVTPGEKRQWIGLSGHNIPSFEIFLSPDWRGTEGVYYADQPSFRNGNYVKNVRLEFKQGRVTAATAGAGESFLRQQIKMDTGACRVGEFSLTDKRFSRINRFMANTLFDENYGGKHGNCHLALGSSYSDTFDGDPSKMTEKIKEKLGFNDSALHWDLVNTEEKNVVAHLTGGGRKTVYENGEFVL